MGKQLKAVAWIVGSLLLGIGLVLYLAGVFAPPNMQENITQESEKIRVGYHPNFGGASVVVIGEEKGFFAEEGLDVELVQFSSGPPSAAALQAGDIQFSFLGHGAYALIIDGQADIIAMDCLSNAEEIMVRADSGIETIEQLIGKKTATPFDTSGENFLDLALQYYGLNLETLDLINMDIAGCVSALQEGKVQAISIWAPYTNEVRRLMGEDRVSTLVDCMDFRDKFVLPMYWVSTGEYLNRNRATAEKFVKALYRCLDYRAAHLDETARLVAGRLGLVYEDIKADTDSGMWMTSHEIRILLEDGSITKWNEDQREFFLEKKTFAHPRRLEEYLHLDLMEKALP